MYVLIRGGLARIREALRDERGLTAIEYGVFAAFVVLALSVAAFTIGPELRDWMIERVRCIMQGGNGCA